MAACDKQEDKNRPFQGEGEDYPSNGRTAEDYPTMGENTPETGGKAFPLLGMTVLPVRSSSQAGPSTTPHSNALAAQRRIQQTKPFAATVVRD